MWIPATRNENASVATAPTRIRFFMSTSPVAKAVPAAAPAQGNMIPRATLGINMAMEAGLKPIYWDAGIKTAANNAVEAVPERKLVLKATRGAETKGSE